MCSESTNSRWWTRQSWRSKSCKNLDEVRTYAESILGTTLVTHQTGPEGKEVKRLLIEEGCDIKRILCRSSFRSCNFSSCFNGV